MTITNENGPGASNTPAQGHDDPWAHSADDVAANQEVRASVAARDKRTANAIARAALKGTVVHVVSGGAFLVCRWGQAREVATLDELETLIERMPGGAR